MRAAIYSRVSHEDSIEGYSLEAQVRAARQYAADRGWNVVSEYIDEGKSARYSDLAKRPQFNSLMQAAESHAFDVVIVHKLDRFARNLRVLLESLERLGKVGVSFVSITEQMDYSSPWGRFALIMLGGLAQLYSDNLSHEFQKGKRERRTQGFYNGVIPFGYKRLDSKLLAPDETTAAALVLAFESAAAGKSDREIAELLNAKGYRSTGNRGKNPWRKDSVRRMLLSRFYMGELPITTKKQGHKRSTTIGWTEGKHPPLVTAELWERAQAGREENRKTMPARCVNTRSHVYSLSGLLRCGYCGMAMRIHPDRGLVCYGRSQGLECKQRSVSYVLAERALADWLARLNIGEEQIAASLQRLQRETPTPIKAETDRRRLQGQLERLKDLYELGDIARDAYVQKRDALRQKLAGLTPLDRKRVSFRELAARIVATKAEWAGATDEQRNRFARELIERIVITDQAVTIEPRPDVRELLSE